MPLSIHYKVCKYRVNFVGKVDIPASETVLRTLILLKSTSRVSPVSTKSSAKINPFNL